MVRSRSSASGLPALGLRRLQRDPARRPRTRIWPAVDPGRQISADCLPQDVVNGECATADAMSADRPKPCRRATGKLGGPSRQLEGSLAEAAAFHVKSEGERHGEHVYIND